MKLRRGEHGPSILAFYFFILYFYFYLFFLFIYLSGSSILLVYAVRANNVVPSYTATLKEVMSVYM